MNKLMILLCLLYLTGCSSSYESLSNECGKSSASSCYKAAEYVWTLRSSDLNRCDSAEKTFCIKSHESRAKAVSRLKDKAIEQNAFSCEKQNNAQACLRVGSSLAIKGIDMPGTEYKPIAERAESFFQKACKLSLQSGCKLRGTTHRAGT